MNLRVTLALVVVAAAVGVVAYINPFSGDDEKPAKSPWFYQISRDDIQSISLTYRGDEVGFVRTGQTTWEFASLPTIPPLHHRWGGITTLLSGPQTRRDLTAASPTIDNPAQYGLDNPETIVNVGLTADRQLEFRLGDKTTDGGHHYAQVLGFPQLFIISAAWGDVIARLVTEPPFPRWYIKRHPDEIGELNLYLGDPEALDTPLLHFKKRDDVWSVRDLSTDDDLKPVDADKWKEEVSALLSGPPNVTVAVAAVDDQDYTPWGIVDDSKAIEIRFEGVTEKGVNFIDGVLFIIGDKTPDGGSYYSLSEGPETVKPVILLDAQWTETLLGLADDIPYADGTEPSAGSN